MSQNALQARAWGKDYITFILFSLDLLKFYLVILIVH